MPSDDHRRNLGAFGESAACAYLTRQGYTICERNWRCESGEIDVIATTSDHVVFVEVRTRRSRGSGGAPEESITPIKQTRLIELAYIYLESYHMPDATPWRIDVITIEVDHTGRIARLNHIPHAVEQT